MNWERLYFVNGTAYAGKSTLVKRLAEAFGGIACQENYHDALLPGLEPAEYPCLTWSRDLQDWRAFIRRTPEEYERWIDGVTLECARLELQLLEPLSRQGRPVFVDTNLSPAQLRQQTDKGHMLILLAEPGVSVTRFFQRPDREKQFLTGFRRRSRIRRPPWKTSASAWPGSILPPDMRRFCAAATPFCCGTTPARRSRPWRWRRSASA